MSKGGTEREKERERKTERWINTKAKCDIFWLSVLQWKYGQELGGCFFPGSEGFEFQPSRHMLLLIFETLLHGHMDGGVGA